LEFDLPNNSEGWILYQESFVFLVCEHTIYTRV